ncbi:MAG: hypothetical protein ACR2KT_07910 [Methylocella sp.]
MADIGGEYTDYLNDAELRNAPNVTPWGHLEKYPFRAASKSDSKNLFEFDQWERCDGAIGFL